MKFMDKELKDLIVTLPLADGTELECGVFAYYTVNEREYFALLPKDKDGNMDISQSYMIYRVEKDQDNNPLIIYIESDYEYAVAANYFSDHYLK